MVWGAWQMRLRWTLGWTQKTQWTVAAGSESDVRLLTALVHAHSCPMFAERATGSAHSAGSEVLGESGRSIMAAECEVGS
jgi:hypothetical protein